MYIFLIIVMVLFGNFSLHAENLNIDRVSEISLFPTFFKNPSYLNSPSENQQNYYVFAHTRFTLSGSNFSSEIQPELRAVQSSHTLTDQMRADVRSPSRLMSLSSKLTSSSTRETVLDVERININYRISDSEISIGRKPISLGVLSIFPVWNKFTRPLVTNLGPLRAFSEDQASVRYQQGAWLVQAIDIEERDNRGATRIGEMTWYGDSLEIHILGGHWWESGAAGIAAVKDVAGTSLRLEEISFSADGMQTGLGAERALNEKWSVTGEYLYLDSGATRKEEYLFLKPSRFRPLSAMRYGYARLEYKPWPLWIFQLADMYNFIDSSQLWSGKLLYSAANDLELTLEIRLPTGNDTSELSRRFLPAQGIAGIRYDF